MNICLDIDNHTILVENDINGIRLVIDGKMVDEKNGHYDTTLTGYIYSDKNLSTIKVVYELKTFKSNICVYYNDEKIYTTEDSNRHESSISGHLKYYYNLYTRTDECVLYNQKTSDEYSQESKEINKVIQQETKKIFKKILIVIALIIAFTITTNILFFGLDVLIPIILFALLYVYIYVSYKKSRIRYITKLTVNNGCLIVEYLLTSSPTEKLTEKIMLNDINFKYKIRKNARHHHIYYYIYNNCDKFNIEFGRKEKKFLALIIFLNHLKNVNSINSLTDYDITFYIKEYLQKGK